MPTDSKIQTVTVSSMRQQPKNQPFLYRALRKINRRGLICVVCHSPAAGYNFDQITCESCKAFFRRNAFTDVNKWVCRFGTNNCTITSETRRNCKYCRLKKCFDQGLRKEWIRTEEEKRNKKRKIEDNRRLHTRSQRFSTLLQPFHSPVLISDVPHLQFSFKHCAATFDEHSNENKHFLTESDRNLLTKVQEHYSRAVQLNVSVVKGYDSPCLRNLNDFVAVLNEPVHLSALRMITFFKLTPEFNCLHENDRLVLVKHNLMAILYLHFPICTNLKTGIFHEANTPNDFDYHASMLRNYSESIYHKTMHFTDEIQQLCSYDGLMMKLLVLILIFSKGADVIEPALFDSHNVCNGQNVYVNLLWNYLSECFGGDRTPSVFCRLMFCCMKSQSLARETKQAIIEKDLHNKKLTPLIESIL